MIVAVDHPTDRPAWRPEFRARYGEFEADGADGAEKGISFSLTVAIGLARRMAAMARAPARAGPR
jgi:hypothetical protein